MERVPGRRLVEAPQARGLRFGETKTGLLDVLGSDALDQGGDRGGRVGGKRRPGLDGGESWARHRKTRLRLPHDAFKSPAQRVCNVVPRRETQPSRDETARRQSGLSTAVRGNVRPS